MKESNSTSKQFCLNTTFANFLVSQFEIILCAWTIKVQGLRAFKSLLQLLKIKVNYVKRHLILYF